MNNKITLRPWQLTLMILCLGIGGSLSRSKFYAPGRSVTGPATGHGLVVSANLDLLSLLVWLGAFSTPNNVAAEGETAWPATSLAEYATGFNKPVHVTHAGDGSGRLFVVEQAGYIRIIDKDGNLLTDPFLDIADRVRCCGEEGLLSVAFPPGYAGHGYFYVYYTNMAGNNVVARYRVTANLNVADAGSEQIVMTLNHPTYGNHNGGQLAFSPQDGYLYIGTGDGGGSGDPFENAQDLTSPLGKLLRIDVESVATDTATVPYTVPPDNPFAGDSAALDEIWALGLRNPWRFSFDRQTGDLYLGDVGQGAREEVDFQPASSSGGENYGWDILEGSLCYEPSSGCTPPSNYSPPVAEYNTYVDGTCAVTGGFVYRGLSYCTMQRIYFYGDYCSGQIWGLQHDGANWQNQLLVDTSFNISSFGEDEAGELYVADHSNGKIYTITAGTPATYPDLADPPGIDLGDIQAAAAHWQQQPGDTAPVWDGRFDIDQDGDMDILDIMRVVVAVGSSCQ